MSNQQEAASQVISQGGVAGAMLIILLGFLAILLFKYYLPSQHAVQTRKVELEAENQKQRDLYNQAQVDRLLKMAEEQQQRFDAQLSIMREEHGKAYTMQRDFFKTEADIQRNHGERTLDKVCLSIDSLKAIVERSFVISLVAAEGHGRSKEDILERAEQIMPSEMIPKPGKPSMKERYETKA